MVRRQLPTPQTIPQRKPNPNAKPMEGMCIAPSGPELVIRQSELSGKLAGNPQLVDETINACLWPH